MSGRDAAAPTSWLRQCWRGRERFVVLSTGAGGIAAFVAAWQAWQQDEARCARLHWIALGASLPPEHDAEIPSPTQAHAALDRLRAAWPPVTRNLHRLAFDAARVQLLFAPGEPASLLRNIDASVDAFLVLPAPDVLAEHPPSAKAFARLAAPDALLWMPALAAGSAARATLGTAGFRIDDVPAVDGSILARFRPVHAARPAIGRQRARSVGERRVAIVGAGLAGCAAAWALAEAGWSSVLLDRHDTLAAEASGNPAGLFHGIVNGHDGSHARLLRAAALEAAAAVRMALAGHGVSGRAGGLLQISNAVHGVVSMRSVLQRLGLPPNYVEALEPRQASIRAGLPLAHAAWFYPDGGWVDPAGLARSFVARAGAAVEWRGGIDVRRLHCAGHGWNLLDADDKIVAQAPSVVLANAGDARRLLGAAWPIEAVRGQLSVLRGASGRALPQPLVPVSGAGYAIAPGDGSLVIGATAQPGDMDPDVRSEDHRRNLAQLAQLSTAFHGLAASTDAGRLGGRTAWRWTTRDRLPLVGAVPRLDPNGGWATDASARLDQPRFVEREPGLFVFGALGSRGITWAALGAQILASAISGAPAPIETSLLDALDPARFLVRDRPRSSRES